VVTRTDVLWRLRVLTISGRIAVKRMASSWATPIVKMEFDETHEAGSVEQVDWTVAHL
jgi:hypothetical protein